MLQRMPYLSRFLPWLVLVLVGVAAPELRATYTQLPADRRGSTIDPVMLKAFRWRSIGPDRAGRALAVAGVKGRPKEAYSAQTGGGLWKTVDGGATWLPVTDGQVHSSSVGAVAVSDSNPDVVFIGMGESCIRGNIQPGDGVYKSTDAGKTWTHVGFGASDAISRIRIHPSNPDVVFVADFGKYSTPSEERGVYKSTDGGKTWQRTLFRDDKTGAVDVTIDPRNPNVVFAALWEAYRIEYQMSSGGPGSGLFKSTDGGDTWTEITRNPGLPAGTDGKIGVVVSGADSTRVYALVENENGGLFSSDDSGATWTLVNDGRAIRQRAFYYTHIAADPRSKDTVFALNVGTFWSRDGGKTMKPFADGDSHDLWIDPDDPNHMVHANDSGGAVSFNAEADPRKLVGTRLPHRPVLSRDHNQARPVSRLRRAAGQHDDVRAERHRARRSDAAVAVEDAGVPATPSAARSPPTSRPIQRIPTCSSRAATTDPSSHGSTGAPARRARSGRIPACFRANRPAPSWNAGSGPIRLCFRPWIPVSSTHPRNMCGRRSTEARRGTGSAGISRVTIPRRWAIQEARSRMT